MGVCLQLVNFEELFRTKTRQPIIINDLSKSSEDDKERINNLIYTRYSSGSELLSNLPSCECGATAGQPSVNRVCPVCGTVCKPQVEQELEPLLWMRSPQGVAPLINPIVWTMLNERFKRSGFEVIRWLCDTHYSPPVRTPEVVEELIARGVARGYNNFVENFDSLMELLFNMKHFKVKKTPTSNTLLARLKKALETYKARLMSFVQGKPFDPDKNPIDPLYALIITQRDCIFSRYLPLPNRTLLVIEETNVGTYVDPIVTGAVDAINTIVAIDSPLSNFRPRDKENRTVKTLAQLADSYDGLYRTTLAKKEGVFRKHVFGTRSHFSFRAVISSLTNRHDYDELHIPWGIGVSLLRIHLENKLARRGMTPNQMVAFLNEHAQKYHPLLDELFKELIAESPYKGIPVVFQRNPSLERGSAQAMYVTQVKTDVDVPTVSLSILSVVGYNADFDGDQLNGTLDLDNQTAEQLSALAPHKSVFGLDAPRQVTKNLSQPKPVVATFSNWIHSHHAEERNLEKEARMAALPEA